MSVVAKAAGIANLAERLACVQQCPAMQKARGVIQTKRIDEFTAGRVPRRKELLKVAWRDPRFGRYLGRTEVRIGKPILDDAADTREQLVRMTPYTLSLLTRPFQAQLSSDQRVDHPLRQKQR